mgnify:CR=1 FL=1
MHETISVTSVRMGRIFSVFGTVGTTEFDALLDAMDTQEFIDTIRDTRLPCPPGHTLAYSYAHKPPSFCPSPICSCPHTHVLWDYVMM